MKRIFDNLRRQYFPRWRAGRFWKVRSGSYAGSGSNCDCSCRPHIKTIFMDLPKSDPTFVWKLIHEICHAVTTRIVEDDELWAVPRHHAAPFRQRRALSHLRLAGEDGDLAGICETVDLRMVDKALFSYGALDGGTFSG